MDTNELELLKQVLPEPFELVNDGRDLWEPEAEWQLPLEHFETAREVIAKMIAVNKAYGYSAGQAHVQLAMKKALGLPEDIRHAVSTAVHAAMR